MPQKCSVCTHPRAAEVNQAMIAGNDSFRIVANRFGLSKASVTRHQRHIAPVIAKAKKAADRKLERVAEKQELKQIAAGGSLLDQLREINRVTTEILNGALAEKDGDTALRAIGRLEKQVALQALLLEQLRNAPLDPKPMFEFDWSVLTEEELLAMDALYEKATPQPGSDRVPARSQPRVIDAAVLPA